ncbi:hypothetical protein [Rufibacter sp. XAAS-G3-1]|uniref:hypothetical protein n=1 Tax=Rufibacter sp. XAAS-G3-1 TaxID=2729134 RepID=UPI0015E7C934|nr:hypothetical protein [Rufibacter sp. XAAS-G3-1]
MQERLRILVEYGATGLIVTFLLLFFAPLCMVFLPVVFNLLLWKKLKTLGGGKQCVSLGIIIGFFTTSVFFLQVLYVEADWWSCTERISDQQANIGYASTMILFSLLCWGYGTAFLDRRNKNLETADQLM